MAFSPCARISACSGLMDAEGNAQELLGHASAVTTKKIYERKATKVTPIR